MRLDKKDAKQKARDLLGFFRFSPFSGTSLAKCDFSQNSNSSKNKKMPNADFDIVHGIGPVEHCFRAGFSFKTF